MIKFDIIYHFFYFLMKSIIIFFIYSTLSYGNNVTLNTSLNNTEIEIWEEEMPTATTAITKSPVYGSIYSGYWSNRNKFYYY